MQGDRSSSASKPSAAAPDNNNAAMKFAAQIHEIQVGFLTTEQWKEAIGNLDDILTPSTTSDDVKESFRLLERLVAEHTVNKNLQEKDKDALNTKILKKVVLNWENWRKLQPMAEEFGPDEVLAVVDDFKICVVALQPDVSTYNAIMAAFASLEGENPKVLAQRVRQIFERIVEPTSKSYETLMRAYIQAGEIETTIEIMDRILEATKKKEGEVARFGSHIFEEALAACANAKLKRGGRLAEDILGRMQGFYKVELLGHTPSLGHHTSVIKAWAKSNHPQAAENAERILCQIIKQSELHPNTITYSTVMDAWAKQGNSERADKLLMDMCDLYVHGNKHMKPDIISFNIVLDAHAKSNMHNAGINAEQRLQLMWELRDTQGIDSKPNVQSYTCVMDAWAGSGHPEAGSRAENVFTEMLHKSEDDSALTPTAVSVSSLANALVKSGNLDRAANVVSNMYVQYEQGSELLKPYVQTFSIIIDGIARKGGRNAGRQAEEFLRKMEKLFVPPNAVSYSSTIHAWSQSGDRQAGQAATRLLQEMLDRARDYPDIKPNVKSYTSAIDAWAKSGHRNSGIEAAKLLQEMGTKGRDDPDVKPNAKSFNSAIDAWAKSGHRNAGIQAETLLQEMMVQGMKDPDMKPDVRSYTSAINAWAKSGHASAGVEAEKLLREMVVQGRENPDMKPNVISFCSTIDAWAKSGHRNAGVEAERLLREMMVQARDNPDVKPNATAFSSAINAWAKSGHHTAGVEAEKLLREMILEGREYPDMKPDVTSFNSTINAWTKSGHHNAGAKAEKLLQEMTHKGRDDLDVKPDLQSYTSVIHAWASQGNVERAEALLSEIARSKDRSMQPNVITFNSVINALSKSTQSLGNKGKRADQYLQEMETLHENGMQNVKPDLVTYTTVLQCWIQSMANPKGKRRVKELRAIIEAFRKGEGWQRKRKQ